MELKFVLIVFIIIVVVMTWDLYKLKRYIKTLEKDYYKTYGSIFKRLNNLEKRVDKIESQKYLVRDK